MKIFIPSLNQYIDTDKTPVVIRCSVDEREGLSRSFSSPTLCGPIEMVLSPETVVQQMKHFSAFDKVLKENLTPAEWDEREGNIAYNAVKSEAEAAKYQTGAAVRLNSQERQIATQLANSKLTSASFESKGEHERLTLTFSKLSTQKKLVIDSRLYHPKETWLETKVEDVP